jgi:O-antigen/teichoic acid export membrane protein
MHLRDFVGISSHVAHLRSIFRLRPFDSSTESGRSKERYRRILLTAASSFVTKSVTVTTGLISVTLTVHYLGAERYGLWATISSVVSLMSFADLGLGNGLLNAISKADGTGDLHEAVKSTTNAFIMLSSIALLFSVFFFSFYPIIPWGELFNVRSEAAIDECGPTMAILFLVFIINLPLGVVERIQIGFQEGYKNQLWTSVGATLSLIGVIITIFSKGGLQWLSLAISGGPLISNLVNGYFLFARYRPELSPKLRYFDFHACKSLFKVGSSFFMLQLFTIVGNSFDNLIIAHSLGASHVATYSITKKLFGLVQLFQFFIQPLWPAFGEAIARKDFHWARLTLYRALAFGLLSSAFFSFALLICGKFIICIWVGNELVPDFSLLLAFSIWAIFVNYGSIMSVFLNSGPLVARQCLFIGVSALTTVFFQICLTGKLGSSAAVWSAIVGYGIFYVAPAYKLAFHSIGNYEFNSTRDS